jgi:hypothetical protein
MITLVDQRTDVRRELPLLPILLAVILRGGDWGDVPQAWGGQVETFGTDTGEALRWGTDEDAGVRWGTDQAPGRGT